MRLRRSAARSTGVNGRWGARRLTRLNSATFLSSYGTTAREHCILQVSQYNFPAVIERISLYLPILLLATTALRAQEVVPLQGTAHPQVTDSFFRAAATDAYTFGVQLQPVSSYFLALTGGAGYYELEATTFPTLNRLDSTGDRRAQLAYAQAYWNIARFQAKRTQARLRREVGFPKLFRPGLLAQTHYRYQNVSSSAQAEWDAIVQDLQREVANTDPVLRSQAFAAEYAAALDTIDMPRLAYSPHGMWVYVGFGPFVPFGNEVDVSGAGGIDMGLGYRYRRLRVGYAMNFNFFRESDGAVPSSPLVDDRGSYQTFAALIGYDLWSDGRFGLTTHAYLGGTSVKTGEGEDFVTVSRGFTPGLSLDLRTRFGPARDAAYYGGLEPRHPFTLFARLTALRHTHYTGDSMVGASAVAGLYIDASMFEYVTGR